MDKTIIKLPRLYTEQDLKANLAVELLPGQAHYLKNVLRKNAGDQVRIFNGRDGEWQCSLSALGKKSAVVKPERLLLEQQIPKRRIHIFFPPIKKQRQDFLIEKAVELGVTDLHPILTQNTETRKINEDRVALQIIEAAEQCERLDLPVLHKISDVYSITKLKKEMKILAALERSDLPYIFNISLSEDEDIGFLAGPEGGFTAEECDFIQGDNLFIPVSLGKNILRSETAFLKFLSIF